MKYTLLLTTHKHPEDAGRVLCEWKRTVTGDLLSQTEFLVVGHEETDKPRGESLPFYRWMVQEKKGCAHSIWAGVQVSLGDWVIYLCDDHLYVDPHWLNKLDKLVTEHPEAKLFKILSDPGRLSRETANIGCFRKDWYKARYPQPVYAHYWWDKEIYHLAKVEGVYCETQSVLIRDPRNHQLPGRKRPVGGEEEGRDLWEARKDRLKELAT